MSGLHLRTSAVSALVPWSVLNTLPFFFPHSCADKIRCEPAGGPATSGKRMLFGGLNSSQKMWPFERLSDEEKNSPNDKIYNSAQ